MDLGWQSTMGVQMQYTLSFSLSCLAIFCEFFALFCKFFELLSLFYGIFCHFVCFFLKFKMVFYQGLQLGNNFGDLNDILVISWQVLAV